MAESAVPSEATEEFDFTLLYDYKDQDEAENFHEELEQQYGLKGCLYDKVSVPNLGYDMDVQEYACEYSTKIVVMMTQNLCETLRLFKREGDGILKQTLYAALYKCITDKNKKNRFIPYYSSSKREFKEAMEEAGQADIPFAIGPMQGWDKNKKSYFMKRLCKLFGMISYDNDTTFEPDERHPVQKEKEERRKRHEQEQKERTGTTSLDDELKKQEPPSVQTERNANSPDDTTQNLASHVDRLSIDESKGRQGSFIYQLGPQRQLDKETFSAAFLSSLTIASKSVAKISWSNGGSGSGWLVGNTRKFVITNHHVIQEPDAIDDAEEERRFEKRKAEFFYDSAWQSGADCLYVNFKPPIYSDQELDVAVIELDLRTLRSHSGQQLPEPLRRFRMLDDTFSTIYLVGHPGGNSKVVDAQCKIIPYTDAWRQARIDWSKATFKEDKYPKIDDEKRVHYDTSQTFGPGSSGCPGFVCETDNEAAVALIHAFALPDVGKADVPAGYGENKPFVIPLENHFEQGIRVEFLYDFILGKDKEVCDDIFPIAGPNNDRRPVPGTSR